MGNLIEFAREVKKRRIPAGRLKNLWQLIPSNTREFVENAENMGITAGIVHKMSQTHSSFNQKEGTARQKHHVTTVERRDIT